jgi:recombination protein RecR
VYEGALQDLVDELRRLPTIGPKSAQRLAFFLLQSEEADAKRLADAIVRARSTVRPCERCFNLAVDALCRVCRDERRDAAMLCVVEGAQDVIALERTREFRGRYHVLGGAISPIDGIGPTELRIEELVARIPAEGVTEVILATNSTAPGDATASYLASRLTPMGVRVTRLASGLPVGGDLDYADEVTLSKALLGRRALD